MGMNFDYGTLGVNNTYATSFKGAPAQQQASMPIMDGPSDLDLLSLSTKQAKTEEKSNTKTILGFVAAAAITAATVYAHSKGKKINGEAGSFFKNIGTGFKNFFKKVGKDGKILENTAKAGKKAQKSIDKLTKAKVTAQEKIDDLTYQLSKHKTDSDGYKEIAKQLETAKKELKTLDKDLVKATKDGLLQADSKYTSMLKVKTETTEQLKALQDEKSALETLVQALTNKKTTALLDADEAKQLKEATEKLRKIGFSAVKGADGKVTTAATGQIKTLEDAIKQQQSAITSYAKNFDDVVKARITATTDAQMLANFKATLGDGATQQAWQVTKLGKLEQAAEASKAAQKTAETTWASAVDGYTIPDFLKKALKLDK